MTLLRRLRHVPLLLVAAVLALTGTTPRPASAATHAEVEVFLATLSDGAKQSWQTFGVPASVVLAQAALESGWGSSSLSKAPNNNYFGIKCGTKPSPYQNGCVELVTKEYDRYGNPYYVTAKFRTYASPAMSMVDHGYYLRTRGLYDDAFLVNEDPRQFAVKVQEGGYATDPGYAAYLYRLMSERNMFRFDWRTGVGSAPEPKLDTASILTNAKGATEADPLLPNTPVTVLAERAGLPAPSVGAVPQTSAAPVAPAASSASASTAPASIVPASSAAPATAAASTVGTEPVAEAPAPVPATRPRGLPNTGD